MMGERYHDVYTPGVLERIAESCDVVVSDIRAEQLPEYREQIQEVEIFFSGWGAPLLNQETLALMPRLRAVFFAAGSLKSVADEAFWRKGLPICSAWAANAVPVAEYTFAQIILCLKQTYTAVRAYRASKERDEMRSHGPMGAFDSVVGLISLGQIGQRVAEMLKVLEVKVVAYDPFIDSDRAKELNVELIGLEELFERSDVVSLHAPNLPETRNMITGDLLRKIRVGGSFINTARGAVVNEPEMIEVLSERPDLTAVLDVTFPEPPDPESPLFELPNVFLTPHIAGSQDRECARMGMFMAEECERFLAGEPLRWSVSEEQFARMA